MSTLVNLGVLLPESVLSSGWFSSLAAFVAVNTVIYVALSVAKILPKIYFTDWITGSNRRAATRSIYPDAPIYPARPARISTDSHSADQGKRVRPAA